MLEGGAGNDILIGHGFNDRLIGGGGNDDLDGGTHVAGGDTADYRASAGGVTVTIDLNNKTTAAGGDAEGDTLENIENVIGGAGNDSWSPSATRCSVISMAAMATISSSATAVPTFCSAATIPQLAIP